MSDIFQYRIRSACHRSSQSTRPNMSEFIRKNRRLLVQALRRSGKPVNECSLNVAANMYAWGICDTFDVTIARGIYELFGAKSVLDFCAGWGDRLIAAIACDVRYTGIDINGELFDGYARAIEQLVPPEKLHKYKMMRGAAEKVRITGAFDMIFTSPPYFASEVYSKDEKNLNRHQGDVRSWLENFLFAAISNAWGHLKQGGHMLLALDDGSDSSGNPVSYMAEVREFIRDRLGCQGCQAEYLGCLGMRYPHRRRIYPIWVWTKRIRGSRAGTARPTTPLKLCSRSEVPTLTAKESRTSRRFQ